ncbi:MAG: epoxyqueuosine reductase QueH [Peptoniphilaceae bacterium]
MNKINYNLKMENIIKNLDKDKEYKLLLHSCCAPCSSAVLERLSKYFKITILYYNPNIDTSIEFERRVKEQEYLIKNIDLEDRIEIMVIGYNSKEYYDFIEGHEDEVEGGKRCELCFELRLEKTAEIAKELGFDFFTTTLSISPHKNSKILNEVGEKAANKYEIDYLYSDFKKKEGYKRSIELSEKYDLYRQDYCGCEFSKKR